MNRESTLGFRLNRWALRSEYRMGHLVAPTMAE
jgi:hypothetical protein